jgi:predicted dienelactone hydrolase
VGKINPYLAVLSCVLLFSGHSWSVDQLYTHQPAVTPELAFKGTYFVGVTSATITDAKRLNSNNFITSTERPLVLEIWYPTDLSTVNETLKQPTTYKDVTRLQKPFEIQGTAFRDTPIFTAKPFPLIILSHGFTGYRTQMFYLGEHLASHGYIVIGIDHTDSTNDEVFDDATGASGFISTLYNRARDQQFVLDYFATAKKVLPVIGLSTQIDTNNAAIIGHSMGGFAALNTVGGCYDFNAEQMKKIGIPPIIASLLPFRLNSCFAGKEQLDPRWKAIQMFAPWGGEYNAHNKQAMNNISVPSLFLAGDQDNTSGFENGVKKLYKQIGSEHKYMLVYENGRHNIAGHPAPTASFDSDFELGHYAEPSWNIETINRVNKHISLAFLDCHVKNQLSRCEYLPVRENIQQYLGSDGKYTDPWPGFKHLWGSGIRFYRP